MTDDLAELGWANAVEFCRESTRWGGGELQERDGIVLFATGSWVPANCNGAIRVDPTTKPSDVIAAADRFFGDRRRGYDVVCRLDGRDDDLLAVCERSGLQTFGPPEPHMVCTVPSDREDGEETVRVITTTRQVADFVAVEADAYSHGMPPGEVAAVFGGGERLMAASNVHVAVADAGGQPAAGALLLMTHAIGGVYWVGTRIADRRHGFGSAVTGAVTRMAFDLGARAAVLDASEDGRRMYERLGYEETGASRRYVRLKPVRRKLLSRA